MARGSELAAMLVTAEALVTIMDTSRGLLPNIDMQVSEWEIFRLPKTAQHLRCSMCDAQATVAHVEIVPDGRMRLVAALQPGELCAVPVTYFCAEHDPDGNGTGP